MRDKRMPCLRIGGASKWHLIKWHDQRGLMTRCGNWVPWTRFGAGMPSKDNPEEIMTETDREDVCARCRRGIDAS